MDDHKLQIVVSSSKSPELKAAQSLRHWLRDEEFAPTSFEVKQERKKLKEDEAGGELLAAIGISVASGILTEFGRSVFGWMKSKTKRDPALSITIKTNNGHEIAISGKDIGSSEQGFIQNLVQIMNSPAASIQPPAHAPIFPFNWASTLSADQWSVLRQTVRTNIAQGKTKSALAAFDRLLEKEKLPHAQSLINVRIAELERAKQAFNSGTMEQIVFDRKINTINKVVLDLLNEISEKIGEKEIP